MMPSGTGRVIPNLNPTMDKPGPCVQKAPFLSQTLITLAVLSTGNWRLVWAMDLDHAVDEHWAFCGAHQHQSGDSP